MPDPQEITITKFNVVSEDVVTREYWDGKAGEYLNTKESMISVNFELLTTNSVQKRNAYGILSLFGDIGGLNDFLILVVTPLIMYIVGDRFSYIILRSLYMKNKVGDKPPGLSDEEFDYADDNDPKTKRKKQSLWLHHTEPYREDWKTQVLLN